MRILRTIAFFMVIAIASVCYATNYYFRAIDVKDGLADYFVRDVSRDSHGYIWISTINGLSRYDGYRFKNYLPVNFGASGNDVSFVRETADKTLWMHCSGDLFTYSHKSGIWQKNGAARLSQLGVSGAIKEFYVDDRKNIWVTTENSIYYYDFSKQELHNIANYSKSPVLHIVSKNGTTVIVNTDFNIYEVSTRDMKLVPIGKAPILSYDRDSRVYLDNKMNLWFYQSHSLAGLQWVFSLKDRQCRRMDDLAHMGNVLVNTLTEDHDGNLWVGTGNSGVHVFSVGYDGFSLTECSHMDVFAPQSSHISCLYLDDNNTMWVGSSKLGVAFTDLCAPTLDMVSTGEYEDVSSLLQDRHGNFWVGFDGGGLMRKSPTGGVTYFSASKHQLPSNIITSLTLDAEGVVLVGTYGSGIARFNGTQFTPVYTDIPNIAYVKAMATDTKKSLWVATVDRGVVRIMPDGKHFHYTTDNSPLYSNGILCLAIDSLRNIIYIGTSAGVAAYDYVKESFVQIDELEKIKGTYVLSLMICSRNLLWIGSRNGLWVYRAKDSSMTCLTTEEGMSHNTIRALAESGDRVWASTDNGLTCITSAFTQDKGEGISFKCHPYYEINGLHDMVFSNNAALTTDNGTVLLGNYSGYTSISPEKIVSRYPEPHVEFTTFWINEKEDTLSHSELTLQNGDRLGIAVSAMLPSLSHKVKYYYRFKGDEEWVQAPNNILYFVSLRPGKHILQVKAQFIGGTEGDIVELVIRVKPPFLLSWPAFLLYALLLIAIIYLIYKAIRNRQKRELAIHQLEMNLRKYEMEEEKIRFFTNISHDIKTPLTLVLAPLEKIRSNPLPADIQTEVDVAWRNSRQLYDLIQQLLDFSRLDVGADKLNLKHGDIVSFVRQTAQNFTYFAIGKQIQLQLNLPQSPIEIAFDENKMRRIVTNLLSNAFKYNVDKGTVSIMLDVIKKGEEREVTLQIADTGIGINDKHHVFERFIQETHGQEQEGSGLGLYIVKKYVEMMGGHIRVSDNKPQGTVFTVILPVVEQTETINDKQEEMGGEMPTEKAIGDKGGNRKPSILIVDDNTDTRHFLQRSLEDEYTVLLAVNGKEALKILGDNENVSIIISDVMMPVMDGIELFRTLKRDINYSHIPVILLTAKSSEENIVSGLQEGVADYITKPFSLPVLRQRIRMILEQAQLMRSQVAHGIEIEPSEITVSSLDEELISRVIQEIEAHIQEIDYSVAMLSSAVGMTRGHLYKKLMAITGKSPLEFIRIIKIKRGKSLLDQGKTNVSEVADMVGFSPKQFTHYFKMMYDVTPSDYLRNLK